MAPPRRPQSSSFEVPLSSRTDPLATFYQILSVQSLHYLTLCIFIPPLLSLFLPYSSAPSLYFEGGPAQIGMILDWRELSSRHTFDWSPLQGGAQDAWLNWRKGLSKEVLLAGLDDADTKAAAVWSAGSVWFGDLPSQSETNAQAVVLPANRIIRQNTRFLGGGGGGSQGEADLDPISASSSASSSASPESNLEQWEWAISRDPSRGWAIAAAWVITCAVDVFLLTTVVRRPKHILDHVATLHLVHLLLTSWYTSSIPTSLFWWTVMIAHGVAAIVWAERQAVQREMSVEVGRGLVGSGDEHRDTESGGMGIPLSVIGAPQPQQSHSHSQSRTHVLFDGEHDDDSADDDSDTDAETARMIGAPKMMSSRSSNSNSKGKKGHKL